MTIEERQKIDAGKMPDMLELSEVHIEESSFQERVCAIYSRDESFNLLFAEGKHAEFIRKYWHEATSLLEHDGKHTTRYCGIKEKYFGLQEIKKMEDVPNMVCLANMPNKFASDGLKVSEIKLPGEKQTRGLMTFNVGSAESDFDRWFESLVLSEALLETCEFSPTVNGVPMANQITEIFDTELRNITEDDMWFKKGRQYFHERINFFTSRHAPIQACLPAFPCKSSNTMKVAGTGPDKGEEMALRRLMDVANMIGDIYPPGIKFWIVSDGHVFSDCIGVDDDVVNSYGAQLRQMYDDITEDDCIKFNSLPELFTSKLKAFEARYTEDVVLPHYLGTKIDPESETCRKVLMRGCSTDPSILRGLIDNSDPAKLALYRGFARFMFEDLSLHPIAMANSKKFCKKLSAKVAFEMIKASIALFFFFFPRTR